MFFLGSGGKRNKNVNRKIEKTSCMKIVHPCDGVALSFPLVVVFHVSLQGAGGRSKLG